MTGDIGHNIAIAKSGFQDTVTIMTTVSDRKVEIARFVHTDKIVGRLGQYPELTEAVRGGDVAAVSFLCAQLFELNSGARMLAGILPIAA